MLPPAARDPERGPVNVIGALHGTLVVATLKRAGAKLAYERGPSLRERLRGFCDAGVLASVSA